MWRAVVELRGWFLSIAFAFMAGFATNGAPVNWFRDPAWVQTIVMVLAVGVAIFVPWLQRYLERRDEDARQNLKAGAVALLVHAELTDLYHRTTALADALDAALGAPGKLTLRHAAFLVGQLSIAALDTIYDRAMDLHLLPFGVAQQLIGFAAVGKKYNQMIGSIGWTSEMDADGMVAMEAALRDRGSVWATHLRAMHGDTKRMLDLITPLLDSYAPGLVEPLDTEADQDPA